KEIEAYCKANKIENLEALVNAMLQRGFTIEKFGEHPAGPTKEVEVKEVEVIKEVVKEVIKEVPVEKIVKVSDDEKTDELLKQVDEL
ncbi:MAG: hypothetical protein GTO02_22420, partial [Candidatus Dadabacteria bacterium]|nr:hypothetical protein [Candidatus Dadabacteria bacterium]